MDIYTDQEIGDLIELHIKNNNVEQIKWLLDNHFDKYAHKVLRSSTYPKKIDILNLFLDNGNKLGVGMFVDYDDAELFELFVKCIKTIKFTYEEMWNMACHSCAQGHYEAFSMVYGLGQLKDLEIIYILLSHHILYMNYRDWICNLLHDNPVVVAVKNGDVNGMINLIDDGLDINARSSCILSLCIAFEQPKLVTLLINNNVIITMNNTILATDVGNMKILQLLLNENLSQYMLDQMLVHCAMRGYYGCVLFLVNNASNLDVTRAARTSLSNPKIFRLLMQEGAELDANFLNYPSMHDEILQELYNTGKIDAQVVLRNGYFHSNAMKFAIELGADFSRFPLRNAIVEGDIENIKLVIDDAPINDNSLETCVDYSQHEIAKLLLERGVEISDDAIERCIEYKDMEMWELLMKFDADIHRNGKENWLTAVKVCNVRVVKVLCDRHVDRGDNERLLSICHKLGYAELSVLLED